MKTKVLGVKAVQQLPSNSSTRVGTTSNALLQTIFSKFEVSFTTQLKPSIQHLLTNN
jgi:hypothetical protein